MKDKKKIIFMIYILIAITLFFLDLILFLNPCFALVGESLDKNDQHSPSKGRVQEEHEDEDILQISNNVIKEFGIEIAVVGSGKFERHVTLPGEIVAAPDRLAHMVPRFPGVVQEIRKQIGDKVKQGEVLAVIENNESLVPYEVKSLIEGVVIDIHLTKGEVTGGASGNVGITVGESQGFIVADLSSVWVNLSVYQKDLPYTHVSNKVIISAGPAIPGARGKIFHITPFLDEKTRTATAIVRLPNPEGYWKPGLFVTGQIITEEIEVPILIPKSAIETIEGKPVVFIKTTNGFKPQFINIGRANKTHAEIVSGISQGQKYVTKNGFTLKAELMKSELELGHSH